MANYDFVAYCNMLADKGRVHAYSKALLNAVSDGCIVLDLGSGTGFFSFLAVRYGAGKVYAFETNPLIDLSKTLAAVNSVEQKIEFINKPSTEIELTEKVDVIVSDLHGILPFFGTSLASIIDARERFLKSNGTMIPTRETVLFAVAECVDYFQENIVTRSSDFGGFDFSSARHLITDRLLNAYKKKMDLLSAPETFAKMDYRMLRETEFTADLRFDFTKGGTACGLRAWFDAELDDQNSVTNAPTNPDTVYGAPFFPFCEAFEVKAGDWLECRISVNEYDEGYSWVWNTDVYDSDGKRRFEFKQSTKRGTYVQPSEILKQSEYFVPIPTDDRNIDLFVLNSFDSETPLGDIAEALIELFPDRFRNETDAFRRVVELVQRYTD